MEQEGTESTRHHADPDRFVERRWLASVVGVRYLDRMLDIVLRTDGLFLVANQRGVSLRDRFKMLAAADRDELLRTDGGPTCWPIESISAVSLEKPRFQGFTKSKTAAVLQVVGTDGSSFSVGLLNQDQVKAVKDEFPKVFGITFKTNI
jgi:hypothetical protein